jgi:type IV secretion system protein VirB11
MLNPDGRLWVDRLSEGLSDTGEQLSAADGERIVRLVAHHVGAEVHARSPRVSAELPESGERFEGLLPPVVAAPTFAIRKPASIVFSLDDYVAASIMSADQAATLRAAVSARANILVAGGTSTGKTTLTNALLAEVASCNAPRRTLSPCERKTVWRRFPIWSVPRCACAPTASPLARCADRKPSTF